MSASLHLCKASESVAEENRSVSLKLSHMYCWDNPSAAIEHLLFTRLCAGLWACSVSGQTPHLSRDVRDGVRKAGTVSWWPVPDTWARRAWPIRGAQRLAPKA